MMDKILIDLYGFYEEKDFTDSTVGRTTVTFNIGKWIDWLVALHIDY